MPSPRNVALVADRELAEAWRNRWFLIFAGAFTVLALAMSALSLAAASGSGLAGLERTAASLMNVVVLTVPLMGLVLGAGAIAGERERGTLLYLAAQPVTLAEIVIGKFLGLLAAVGAAVATGFGVAGWVIAGRTAGPVAPYLGFVALALLVAAAAVSLGLLVSALARKASVALGVALLVWLVLVLLGDLGLLGTSLALSLDNRQLLTAALANPLEVYKVASMLVLRGSLEVLGPADLYAARALGDALLPALVALLAAWVSLPLAAAVWAARRRGALP